MSTIIQHLSDLRRIKEQFGDSDGAFSHLCYLLVVGHAEELEQLAAAALNSARANVPANYALVDRDFLTAEQRMELMRRGELVDATHDSIDRKAAPIEDVRGTSREREDFEAWYDTAQGEIWNDSVDIYRRHSSGPYWYTVVQVSWVAWQAGRASLQAASHGWLVQFAADKGIKPTLIEAHEADLLPDIRAALFDGKPAYNITPVYIVAPQGAALPSLSEGELRSLQYAWDRLHQNGESNACRLMMPVLSKLEAAAQGQQSSPAPASLDEPT